uniref:RxLR effector protein n=1 Tax=Steinernema glaseri TaxID=37863 RepID=A0A1I8AEC0_9BILA
MGRLLLALVSIVLLVFIEATEDVNLDLTISSGKTDRNHFLLSPTGSFEHSESVQDRIQEGEDGETPVSRARRNVIKGAVKTAKKAFPWILIISIVIPSLLCVCCAGGIIFFCCCARSR